MNNSNGNARKNAVLIPALNPPESLEKYIKELVEADFKKIILVDDGSDQSYQALFKRIADMEPNSGEEIILLRHEQNYGKGRALKTGFSYFLNNCGDLHGIITVDSDGQHLVKDVIKISDAIDGAAEPTMVLGTRSFDYDYVPPKSKFGNKLTCAVFSALNGKYIHDTQTGLRGFTKSILTPEYLNLSGERFEYEINMLIYAVRNHFAIEEIGIETVYINENKSTHFHPLKDSWKVYKVLFSNFFRYAFSSLASCIIDLGLFQLLMLLFANLSVDIRLLAATVAARIVSSLFNFAFNKKIVFQNEGKFGIQLIKYYSLCIVQMLLSAFFVIVLDKILGINHLVEKIFVDTILFFVSYHIQRSFIFSDGGKGNADI